MKLFKLTSTPNRIWENGQPTNNYKTKVVYVNPEYIISIEPLEGIAIGSKVTVQGALVATHYDARLPEELYKLINKIK